MKITKIIAREVIDSRGNPTVEVVMESDKHSGRAIVPSGASTGSHEAHELRDNDSRRFSGKGVLKAVDNVNKIISRKLKGEKVLDQRKLDEMLIELDGTTQKSNLGANAILGVSLAYAHLRSEFEEIALYEYIASLGKNAKKDPKPRLLPLPLMNIINGGVHASSGLDFQEIMIAPAGAGTFKEAVRMGCEVFHTLKKLIADKGFATSVGDEGGFAPQIGSHEAALDLIVEAIKKSGYTPGDDIYIALDVASSEFYKNGVYTLKIKGKEQSVTHSNLLNYYSELARTYPIFSIEDGCAEDDWAGWRMMTELMGKNTQLVGDDLFVTNHTRLSRGISENIANSILIKPNQIGTITETIDVIDEAKKANYTTIVSHRSGETEDVTIAHLAVGLETGQIKTGSLSRSERIAKYNELIRIEETLGRRARFAGLPKIK